MYSVYNRFDALDSARLCPYRHAVLTHTTVLVTALMILSLSPICALVQLTPGVKLGTQPLRSWVRASAEQPPLLALVVGGSASSSPSPPSASRGLPWPRRTSSTWCRRQTSFGPPPLHIRRPPATPRPSPRICRRIARPSSEGVGKWPPSQNGAGSTSAPDGDGARSFWRSGASTPRSGTMPRGLSWTTPAE